MPCVPARHQIFLRQALERAAEPPQPRNGFGDDFGIAGVVGGHNLPHRTPVFSDLKGLASGSAVKEFAEAGFGVEGGDDFHGFQLVADWLNMIAAYPQIQGFINSAFRTQGQLIPSPKAATRRRLCDPRLEQSQTV